MGYVICEGLVDRCVCFFVVVYGCCAFLLIVLVFVFCCFYWNLLIYCCRWCVGFDCGDVSVFC